MSCIGVWLLYWFGTFYQENSTLKGGEGFETIIMPLIEK